MEIQEFHIPLIERAIGFRLYQHQVDYLLGKGWAMSGRRAGKTVAHCIKLALSDGEPLNLRKPYEFSDYGDGSKRYAYDHYVREFLRIREMLKNHGFLVRDVKM